MIGENVMIRIIDRMPDWTFAVLSILLIIGLVLGSFYLSRFAKNVLKALESESSALAISQENSTLTSQNSELQDANTQYHHSLQSINHLFEDLIDLRNDCHQTYEESLEVIKKIIDTLPLSLSSSRGDSKRCAVWLSSPTTNTLDFHTGSFNFPKDYTNSRKLDIDDSTGGRCYRKNEIIDLDDVSEDPDWLKNEESRGNYKSLICIPILNLGILTVDSLSPFNQESRNIICLYAKCIELAYLQMFDALKFQDEELNGTLDKN
ncbi:hypothetical protein DH09_02420 [Bacillaceae bacterium JMAK1]|nr:hypothetical protein DH09_02420 [Bacillaceae bacterium JMAK1]